MTTQGGRDAGQTAVRGSGPAEKVDTAHVDAALVAAVVEKVPGVRGLHGGRFGEFATFMPHRRVVGVRVRDEHVTVAVTVRYPVVVSDVAAAIRTALDHVNVPVHVVIADVDVTTSSATTTGRKS